MRVVLFPKGRFDVLRVRLRNLACSALVASLIGCGANVTQSRVTTVGVHGARLSNAEPVSAAPTVRSQLTTRQRYWFRRWINGVYLQRWLTALQPQWHYDWPAVATCETGGNWNMVGSVYSTGLGMMNQAIIENAPSSSAAQRMLSGTASITEIEQTAEQIAARHGIQSWGCWRAALR